MNFIHEINALLSLFCLPVVYNAEVCVCECGGCRPALFHLLGSQYGEIERTVVVAAFTLELEDPGSNFHLVLKITEWQV